MKEERFFYAPNATQTDALPEDEGKHAVRVLRLSAGDEIFLIDGSGSFHRAEVTMATPKRCNYRILESLPQNREWQGRIHLAMAPTKMMDRTEWFAEKATEIGIDEFSFLDCKLSERHQLRTDRIERIVVGAVKQSRKAWMPKINEMLPFREFIKQERAGEKYIAHCYDDIPREELSRLLLKDPATESQGTVAEKMQGTEAERPVLGRNLPEEVTILIGPEGDFHRDEVEMAIQNGYRSISLGTSRLRTETACLAAVMTARLAFSP